MKQELNRALLARQLLLERVKVPIPKVLERMGTLQAQYAPSMYVGLWTRMEGFEREQLDRALEKRTVAQGTLMRATIHLVSKADYWPAAIGVRRSRREAWLNARKDYSARQMSAAAAKLRRQLGDGTMSRKEIHELLGSDSVVTNGVNMWLDLVRVPPSGTWERRRADLYAASEHWLGEPPKSSTSERGSSCSCGAIWTGFGPAPVADIANWAGLHPKRIEPVTRLDEAALVRGRGWRRSCSTCLGRRSPIPKTPAPPRFLGVWDATLLTHARRTGVLPEEHRPKVFNTRTPQSMPTFMVDGRVAGTWSYEKGRVKLEPFERLDAEGKARAPRGGRPPGGATRPEERPESQASTAAETASGSALRPWSPRTSTTSRSRPAGGMPKRSLSPWTMRTGTVTASSSGSRLCGGLSPRRGGRRGNARQRTAAAPVSGRVRHATRAPSERPPTTSGRSASSLAPRCSTTATHASSSRLAVAGARFPATRYGCSTRATL